VLQVLVPLLVEAAAPDGAPTPVLWEMALKLITALPAAPAGGAAARAAIASLPPAAKARLQAALQASAAGGGGGGASAAGPRPAGAAQPARPAIQLKTSFALPKPGS
jgi:hypothetical protein